MKRSDEKNKTNNSRLNILKKLVAYHEAGHAAAIYFNNRLKKLPPIFFKIILGDLNDCVSKTILECRNAPTGRMSRITGGRLIHSLPFALDGVGSEAHDSIVFHFTDGYHPAFEADIVNLLIGPLAEAKFIALIDDEPFKFQLLSAQALNNYGGETDLALVYEYLQSYSADPQVQNQSLRYFLRQAFDFVDDQANWKAITQLADYILASNKNEVSYEEAAFVLEQQNRVNRLI